MKSRHDVPAHVQTYAQALSRDARQTRLQPQVPKPPTASHAHGARAANAVLQRKSQVPAPPKPQTHALPRTPARPNILQAATTPRPRAVKPQTPQAPRPCAPPARTVRAETPATNAQQTKTVQTKTVQPKSATVAAPPSLSARQASPHVIQPLRSNGAIQPVKHLNLKTRGQQATAQNALRRTREGRGLDFNNIILNRDQRIRRRTRYWAPGDQPRRVRIPGTNRWGLDPGNWYHRSVVITYTGSRNMDYAVANGVRVQPPNTTWHHYHDYAPGPNGAYGRGTMYLMDSIVHNNIAHDGGVWQFTQAHGIGYLP